jgi:DNA mismatch repair ATPase MutS
MEETKNITENCTDRSLLLIDELGRGTSTYDGISIAWSVLKYLIETRKNLILYSTHSHHLLN